MDSSQSGLRMSLRERPKRNLSGPDEGRFLDDFDPDKSEREKRKQKKKLSNHSKQTAYDENGFIRANGMDVCDCLDNSCEGCWNPCRTCGSCKCGPLCRVNRRAYYDSVTFDGKDGIIRNPNFPGK